MEKDHGLRIPNEASIHKNPKRLGWGRRIGQIDFGAFGILSAELQAPMFFINQPLFLQKLSIYTVKSRAVDRSTIQFSTIFGVLLTEMCY